MQGSDIVHRSMIHNVYRSYSLYTSPGHTEEQRQVLYNLPPGKQQNTTLHLGGRPLRLFFSCPFALFWTMLLYVPCYFFPLWFPHSTVSNWGWNRDRYDSANLFFGVPTHQPAPGKTVQHVQSTNRSLIEVMNRHVLLAFFQDPTGKPPLLTKAPIFPKIYLKQTCVSV